MGPRRAAGRIPEGFQRLSGAHGRIWILRHGFPPEAVQARGDDWLAGREGEMLTRGGGRAPVRSTHVEGVGEVVVRRYFHGGLFSGWTRDRLSGTRRPLLELEVSERIRQRGVATPEVLALVLRRGRNGFYRGCVLTRRVPDSENLREWLVRAGDDPSARRAVLRQAARAVAALHRAGCRHGDLNLSNLQLTPKGIVILDLDGARLRNEIAIGERGANLLRLYRSLRKETGRPEPLAGLERVLFLRHYAAGNRPLFRALASWLRRRWALSRLRRPSRRR